MHIPPIIRPQAYATHLLLAWQAELLRRQALGRGAPSQLLQTITAELARRNKPIST
ncbi:MAG: hypothetical protein ACRYFZ_07275 [Janthinobacterium lividum]